MALHVLVHALHRHRRVPDAAQVRVLRVQALNQPRQVALQITPISGIDVLAVLRLGDRERLHERDHGLEKVRGAPTGPRDDAILDHQTQLAEERVDHPLPFLQWIVGRKSVGPLGCGFLQRGAQELEDKKKENGLRKTDLLLCLRELRSAWIGMALASAAAGFVWVEWVWAVLEWRAWIPTPSFLTQQLP